MNGIILVNKPKGISSNAAVNLVKHSLGAKKCGHLGTLDLEGEGLLPVTVNSATKLFDFFLAKDKTYETTFVFGFETDTLDLSGKVIKEKKCNITLAQVIEASKKMIGKQQQMPPQYSAKKVGGKVAYKQARNGMSVDLQPKEIEIYSIDVLKQEAVNTFRLKISCSSGTYIRSICRDMAELLSTYGSMQCILRTRCGNFKLEDASTLDEIKAGKFKMISCEDVFDYEKIHLSKEDEFKLINGQLLPCDKHGNFRLYGEQFLGVGEAKDGKLKLSLRLF